MKKVLVVVASNQKNLELGKKILVLLEKDCQAELLDLVAYDLPLFTPKRQAEGTPEQVHSKIENLKSVDAFYFVAPEYNGGVPPALTNFLAWFSVTSKDWRECFNGKPAAIATHSGGGGIHVLAAMRQQLSYIGMNVIGQQIQTNSNKELNPDSLKSINQQLLKMV